MSIQKRVLSFIKEERLWSSDQSVCIAVSGGVDSMVLMHLLHRTQRAHGGILEVCTMDHQFRPESKEECRRVEEEARKIGLPVQRKVLSIPLGGNLYERARIARKEALSSLGCDVVATGHHQADQAETLLYRLLRGSGLSGLASMSSKRDGWCRPLLRESKEEICSFASKEQIWWTEDPSNSKSIRGSLRAIFPLLDGIHGASIPAIARSARLLSEDAALLEQYTKEAWSRVRSQRGLNTEKWKQEPAAMQRRLLKNLCLIHEIPIRASILSQFQKRPTRVQLPGGGWLMTMEGDIVVCPATP